MLLFLILIRIARYVFRHCQQQRAPSINLRALAALSDGTTFPNLKALPKSFEKIKRRALVPIVRISKFLRGGEKPTSFRRG
jgi:hypothetical protein